MLLASTTGHQPNDKIRCTKLGWPRTGLKRICYLLSQLSQQWRCTILNIHTFGTEHEPNCADKRRALFSVLGLIGCLVGTYNLIVPSKLGTNQCRRPKRVQYSSADLAYIMTNAMPTEDK